MAYTYEHTPVLARIKIGETYSYLKDADARAILDTYNDNITTGTLLSTNDFTEGGSKIPTEGAVKSYVDEQVGALVGFDAIVVEELPTASDKTQHKIYLVPVDPDEPNGIKNEYITVKSGTEDNYTYSWEEVGSTNIDLSDYLTKNSKVAGVAFGDDKEITTNELSTALDLQELSHLKKSDLSVPYNLTYPMLDITPSGTINANFESSMASIVSNGRVLIPGGTATGNFTPEGNVSATKSENGAFTVGGSVNIESLSVNLNKQEFLSGVSQEGVTPSFTEGVFTPASLAYNQSDAFAKAGVTVEMGTGEDSETLIFTTSETGTASVISAFDGGSKTADTFVAGSMPVFAAAQAAVGVESATGTASFSGDKYDLTFTGTSSDINTSFQGSSCDVEVEGSYDKVYNINATFVGNPAMAGGQQIVGEFPVE